MTIRPVQPEDAEKALTFFRTLVTVDQERVERPEDVAHISIENERRWLETLIQKESEKSLFARIGVLDTGEIGALAEVERKPRWIEQHVAEVRFGALPEYGDLARETVKACITEAEASGITELFYFHLETQSTGIQIMKDLGFVECGRIERYYRRGDNYISRIYLSKSLA